MKLNDFDIYQKKASKTAIYPKIGEKFIYPVLGLMGEAGEVAEKFKKLFRDNGGKLTKEKKEEIAKELGDVLWYIAQISTELNIDFSSVVNGNLEKLESRQERDKIHGDGDTR